MNFRRSLKNWATKMGTFGGHALPGTFFIIFAIWWTIMNFNRYYSSRRRNSRFTSTATFTCPCLCGRLKDWPIEGIVKIFFTLVGFSFEIYTGFWNGKFVNIGNGQHATMFFYFGFTGIIDILLYFKAPLPPDMDYVSMLMAVTCEGLLFKFHLHGRTELDVLLHTLLIYVIGAAIVSVIVEMKFRHNVLSPLTRAYLLLLQGTWFWQVGWILYPPFESSARWDGENHEQLMVATMIFAWHAFADLLIMLCIGGVVARFHRQYGPYIDKDGMVMKKLIHSDDTRVTLSDDSDNELEFERRKKHDSV